MKCKLVGSLRKSVHPPVCVCVYIYIYIYIYINTHTHNYCQLNAAMKVNIYFVIWHLIEPNDFVCQPHNSHMTKKYIFVQLNLTKSDK